MMCCEIPTRGVGGKKKRWGAALCGGARSMPIAICIIHQEEAMIQVVEVDEKNRTVQVYKAQPTLPKGCDVITLNPGVPPLGSQAFDWWLEKWHREHNSQVEVRA